MLQHQTTRCRDHGHAEITLQFRDRPPVPVEKMLLGFFERGVAAGKTFAPGQTVQLGWATLRLCARPDRTLGVEERDVSGWVETCDRSLMATWFQKEVVASVGLIDRLTFPTQGQSALACDRVLATSHWLLSRSQPRDAQDSGWLVLCGDPQHDHTRAQGLHAGALVDLSFRLPFLTQFFALPAGCDVLVQTGPLHGNGAHRIHADVYFERAPLAPAPGSYLASLNA